MSKIEVVTEVFYPKRLHSQCVLWRHANYSKCRIIQEQKKRKHSFKEEIRERHLKKKDGTTAWILKNKFRLQKGHGGWIKSIQRRTKYKVQGEKEGNKTSRHQWQDIEDSWEDFSAAFSASSSASSSWRVWSRLFSTIGTSEFEGKDWKLESGKRHRKQKQECNS